MMQAAHWHRLRHQAVLLYDLAAVYGVHFATQALPLVTIPYLSRTLGPATWGLVAMAQAFAVYGNLLVDYGFLYSATREVATASGREELEEIVAGIWAAKLLLSGAALLLAGAAWALVPLFRQHPLLLWAAVLSEIVKALMPGYFFYGIHRVSIVSALDIGTRLVSAAGIFLIVHKPQDAWKVFALNGGAGCIALLAASCLIYSRCSARIPRPRCGWFKLRSGWDMFLFRGAHNFLSLGNAFILGLFVPAQTVGFYAGAEKLSNAAVGALSPFTSVLYPRVAKLAATDRPKAARLTVISLGIMGTVSIALLALLWSVASAAVPVVLGKSFGPSIWPFKILSWRAPLSAFINILGFQWLLALGLEKQFQKVTMIALLTNLALAALLAPRLGAPGMAYSVVASQAVAVMGIYLVLRGSRLNPVSLSSSDFGHG